MISKGKETLLSGFVNVPALRNVSEGTNIFRRLMLSVCLNEHTTRKTTKFFSVLLRKKKGRFSWWEFFTVEMDKNLHWIEKTKKE